MDNTSNSTYQPLIFVAEDVPRNLQVLYNILKKENFRIAAAGNGKQALDMIPEVLPDLILLDVMMPEMDGFDVCRHLKQNPKTKDIPIIFLTAKTETEDIVTGFEIGAVDYVTKPFRGTELISRVKTHLELKFSRQSLEELNATKDTFFSIIAHDMRDPLQYLILAAETLYHDYDVYDEEQKRDYIRRFYNNSNQLSALLENLLEWARSQSGSIVIEPGEIDVAQLVGETIELLAGNAQEKDIKLTSLVNENVSAFADRNMILAVLRNLVANAVKFSHPGGRVTINAEPNKKGDRLSISVSDNGVGIEPENIERLFRIDIKKNTLGTSNEKGTGLGLIICKEFVEKNNGSISVHSEPGKGSTFEITLPATAS